MTSNAKHEANPATQSAVHRADGNSSAPDGKAALDALATAERQTGGVSDSLPTDAETMQALAADMRAFIAGGKILP